MLGHYHSKAIISFAPSFESWKYFKRKKKEQNSATPTSNKLKQEQWRFSPEILVLQLEKQICHQ